MPLTANNLLNADAGQKKKNVMLSQNESKPRARAEAHAKREEDTDARTCGERGK